MSCLIDSRRGFLKTLGGGLASPILYADAKQTRLPDPGASGIQHIVVLTMENRSFDHFLGWLKGADGRQSGLTYYDNANVPQSTYHLNEYQGCGHPLPDNTSSGAIVEYNNGACDGWLRAGSNDRFVIGYYEQEDLPFLGEAAKAWTTCDRYFSATLSETFPNRMYLHAGRTDRQENSLMLSTLPTIWDSLLAARLNCRYYFSDVPFLALWGGKYRPISRPLVSFFADCALGTLPHVSFVDPRFLGESAGLSNDDHPHSDIRNGEAFMNAVYTALTRSPAWQSTVLVINFDEWGGFFDHVAPDLAPDVGSNSRRGFRVPCLLISPWSSGKNVSSNIYDHASVLKMIEWRWNLPALAPRDSAANNLAEALDFGERKAKTPPVFRVPAGPFGEVCGFGAASSSQTSEWVGLGALAQSFHWF